MLKDANPGRLTPGSATLCKLQYLPLQQSLDSNRVDTISIGL